jgi:hypothetical protein
MERVLKLVLTLMPMIFALGFLAPVIAQSMDALGWTAPFALSNIMFALIIAGILGLSAQVRGSWV